MSETQPEPNLSQRVLAAIQTYGPLTFTQVVHATRTHRGSTWRVLKQLQHKGDVTTQTQHGQVYYCATEKAQGDN